MYKSNRNGKTITIKMDNNSILRLLDSSLSEFLLIVIQQSNKETYMWYSSTENRQYAVSKLGLSIPTISRLITKLKDKGILQQGYDIKRGHYRINSNLIRL